MSDVAINVKHVSKNFRLYHEKRTSIYESVAGYFSRKQYYETIRVLDDVTFDVKKGEMVGIIGKNGSGKTTLLRVLSNIYKPDSGSVEINGIAIPLLALGLGFHPELTAITNIVQSSTLLGIPQKNISKRIDDVLKFAELEKFGDVKLKNFSSGMAIRLAFSTAIQVDPDILILDEVFAVGDLDFQKKCFDTIMSFKKKGKAILFVSHDVSPIQNFCDRAIFLNQGKIEAIGKSETVVHSYLSSLKNKTLENNILEKKALEKKKDNSQKITSTYWNELPQVNEYLNNLATDDLKKSPIEDINNRFSSRLPFQNVLVIGTLKFQTVKDLLNLKIAQQIDVIDTNLENIKNSILQKNYLPINYFHQAYDSISKLNKKYDAIFCGPLLNYIDDIDSFFKSLNHMLNKNGIIFIHDYIGPSKMHFSNDHVKLLQQINSDLPEKFRTSFVLNELPDPNLQHMVTSPESLKNTFLKYFDLEFSRNLNGGIAYPLLFGNIGKFQILSNGTKQLVNLLKLDKEYSENNKVPILFWYGVGNPKIIK